MREFASELRAQREASGLSLEELFERTRINPEYLNALETGNYDILPEIYIRLFLKRYAQEVGLDVQATLDKYGKTRPHATSRPPVVRREREQSLSLRPILAILREQSLSLRPILAILREQSLSLRPILAILCVLALGAVIAAVMLRRDSTSAGPVEAEAPMSKIGSQSTSSALETSATPEPEIHTAPPESQAVTAAPESLQTAPRQRDTHRSSPPGERVVSSYSLPQRFSGIWEDDLILSVRAVAETQVRISSDGDSTFESRLLSGTQRHWTARDRFRVEIEDAAAVSLSLQETPIPLPIKHGRKHRLFISRSNIWVEEIEPEAPPSVR